MRREQRQRIFIIAFCGGGLVMFFVLFPRDPAATPRSPLSKASPDPAPLDRNVIYAQADVRFASAYLLKPDHQRDGNREFGLAPLLLERAADTAGESLESHLFGAVTLSATGEFRVSPSPPTIYFNDSTAILRGKEYRQLSYEWWYPPSRGPRSQGFRMTFDDKGMILIWEVLTDGSGPHLIFVVTALEDAARKEYGEPLPERRYSIEASVSAAPDVIVPRVVRPGPMPMGPFLYLEHSTHDVVTLICRCMLSQVDNLAGDGEYELKPRSDLESSGLEKASWSAALPRKKGTPEPAFGERQDPGWLERCLRLPVAF